MSSGRVGLRAEGLALVNETGPSWRAEQKENISIPAGSSLPLFAAWPSTYNGRQIRKYWGLVPEHLTEWLLLTNFPQHITTENYSHRP